jgi:hypothetical protein
MHFAGEHRGGAARRVKANTFRELGFVIKALGRKMVEGAAAAN